MIKITECPSSEMLRIEYKDKCIFEGNFTDFSRDADGFKNLFQKMEFEVKVEYKIMKSGMIKGKKYIQQDGVVILAIGKKAKAIVIKDPKNMWGIGYYAKDWNLEAFTEYLDDIVL